MTSFVLAAILTIIIGLFGLFGNVNIVVATVRINPKVKSNLLMGILASADLVCIVFEFQNAFRILAGIQSHRRECFWFMSPYMVTITFQAYVMCALAFDRLYALTSPLRYQKGQNSTYVLLLCLPGALLSLGLLVLGAVDLDDAPIIDCNPPLAFTPSLSVVWNNVMLACVLATLLGYVTAFCVLIAKTRRIKVLSSTDPSQAALRVQHKLTKSCQLVIVAFIFTAFLAHTSIYVIYWFRLSQQVADIYVTFMVVPAMMNYSQSFYVYCCCSKTYREAIREQLLAIVKSRGSVIKHSIFLT
uniref:G_PROTEIN_RECEP_F1_2 domain-containing protein n=1 Tax=Steinernema glaseri TaxID=37863 RepID=A0A1I7YLN9_9BILA